MGLQQLQVLSTGTYRFRPEIVTKPKFKILDYYRTNIIIVVSTKILQDLFIMAEVV
jgi:hypothetical protein